MKTNIINSSNESGFVLIATMMCLGLMMALLAAYFTFIKLETGTIRHSKNTSSGFYAAEAGVNIRADDIRQVFVGYNRPTGTAPSTTSPCTSGNMGSGDFSCSSFTMNNRNVSTYVSEDASNPVTLTIPLGERYQNLSAQEYRYTATGVAVNTSQNTEAQLELQFKSRLVPLFQFAAFYNKDLEILPSPVMTLAGPVHTNGDLYLMSDGSTLTINGQVTTAGRLYRGRKNTNVCTNNTVQVPNPSTLTSLVPTCPSRTQVTSSMVTGWNNMIQIGVQQLTVPDPGMLDPTAGNVYWDKADARVVLSLNGSGTPIGVQIWNQDRTNNSAATTSLNACAGTISGRVVGTTSIYNFRENGMIRLLEVDMQGLLNCLRSTNWFGSGKLLSDSTEGGLVFHMTVNGPLSNAAQSFYGVRVRNAATLQSSAAGAPAVRGITLATDQAMYTYGHYNSVNKIPAAIMADTINVLSGAWNDANATAAATTSRQATSTTVNAAFLANSDTTGNVEGTGGQGGAYNGGLENYPRFSERWTGTTLTYRGSLVSLGRPRHATGGWPAQSYAAPARDWNYDTSFNNAANLPPLTPRFVYLRQEQFVRDFEQ